MVVASQLRHGMAIRYEGIIYKVIAAEYHGGQGKMGGVTHARLTNIDTGTLWEHRFRSDAKLEEIPLEKQQMDFLYADGDDCYFMNPETFEQVPLSRKAIGPAEKFLRPEMRVPIEFFGGRPVSVGFPDIVDVRVADTAQPTHTQQDNTWKPATLENGMEIMVPQFIRPGETIRVDVETGKYVERARVEGKKA
jgi:elongation factor P